MTEFKHIQQKGMTIKFNYTEIGNHLVNVYAYAFTQTFTYMSMCMTRVKLLRYKSTHNNYKKFCNIIKF